MTRGLRNTKCFSTLIRLLTQLTNANKLRGFLSNNRNVAVPKMFSELSSERMITMEWIQARSKAFLIFLSSFCCTRLGAGHMANKLITRLIIQPSTHVTNHAS